MTGRIPGAMIQPASVGTAQLTDAAVTEGKQAPGLSLPTGSMAMFAGAAAPTGWRLCDGALVSRATFAALFAAIGTTWGVGDGSTTFALPDLRGRSPIGAGTGPSLSPRTLAATGGAETHVLAAGEMPTHTHRLYGTTGGGSGSTSSLGIGTVRGLAGSSDSAGAGYITNAPTGGAQLVENTGSGTAHNNMQPFAVVNYIIKT